jgi:CNT family concentrative nucleoside transporter
LAYSIENGRSLLAVVAIIAACWLFSEDKKRFPVLLVLGALALQAALIFLIFALPNSTVLLQAIGGLVGGLGDASAQGAQFVFGFLAGAPAPYLSDPHAQPLFVFGFRVLPVVLVICALSALLWHWGVLRLFTRAFGVVFSYVLGLSGPLALGIAANMFLGMVESAMVVRAYLQRLSRSELFTLMAVGLANVSGSTMVAYTIILAPVLPNAAAHILTASIVSTPAGVLLARILIPETSATKRTTAEYESGLKFENSMDALATGVRDGATVAVNIAAFLVVAVALVAIVNDILALAPHIDGAPVTLQSLFGRAFAPVAWLIGAQANEALSAGRILADKLFLTEFAAFIDLGHAGAQLSEHTRMIMTYAVCGFANVASVGILSGGLSALVPERRNEIFGLAWRALLPGFLATLMTASIVAALPAAVFAH